MHEQNNLFSWQDLFISRPSFIFIALLCRCIVSITPTAAQPLQSPRVIHRTPMCDMCRHLATQLTQRRALEWSDIEATAVRASQDARCAVEGDGRAVLLVIFRF